MTNKDQVPAAVNRRIRRVACFTLFAMLIAAALPASQFISAQTNAQVIRNIEYARADGKSLLLDLYLPAQNAAKLPVIMWVHGGGWATGDKGNGGPASRMTARGYAVASINYRLSWEARFPAQIEDYAA